ncbi:MAG: NAD(P)H-dependent oxidoreductase [Anaerovoracaceae bacterium]
MEKILFVNGCIRPESRTRKLARHVLNKLDGSGTIEEINLQEAQLSPIDIHALNERNALIKEEDFTSPRFKYAQLFSKADVIVIAAPYWDLSFPSMLKVFFEHIAVLKLTFKYSPEGKVIGLCNARELIYITTSGGPIGSPNFGFEYVKALAQHFYGIKTVRFFYAKNLDIKGNDAEEILNKAFSEIEASQV